MASRQSSNGVFDWLMGAQDSSGEELERWSAIIDAESVFEGVIAHVARTTFGEGDDLKVRLALSAVLGAWTCVKNAREAS